VVAEKGFVFILCSANLEMFARLTLKLSPSPWSLSVSLASDERDEAMMGRGNRFFIPWTNLIASVFYARTRAVFTDGA
jgi:hypothetical protein